MYKLIILILVFSFGYIGGWSTEYTHIDGSQISISIPQGLTGAVRGTIEAKIQGLVPPQNINNTVGLPTMSTEEINLEEIIEKANWEHTVQVRKIYSDENITSVLITSYEYTGGAHGSLARIGLVMETKTGKILTLGDFYDTNKLTKILAPVWQKQIGNRLRASMDSSLTSDEKKWIHDGVTDLQQYQSFVLTPRVLVVYGQQYQHNAYAYGMQTLTFPRNRLINIIK